MGDVTDVKEESRNQEDEEEDEVALEDPEVTPIAKVADMTPELGSGEETPVVQHPALPGRGRGRGRGKGRSRQGDGGTPVMRSSGNTPRRGSVAKGLFRWSSHLFLGRHNALQKRGLQDCMRENILCRNN